MTLFPDRLPWFVAGPLMGLAVVLLFAIANRRLGVTGAYGAARAAMFGQPLGEAWRLWFFLGIAAGAALVAMLRGDFGSGLEYGALGRVVPLVLLVPLLFAGGVLAGYGSKWADGCTSGHGLSGVASRSPASWAAAATFFGTAVVVTLLINAITGGAL